MPSLYREMSYVPPPRVFWPLLGLGIVLASEAATVIVLWMFQTTNSLIASINFYAILAALLAGLPTWWLFIVKPRHATIRRGILVGALGSIIAHPILWMFMLVDELRLGSPDNIFLVPLIILDGPILSLIAVGWITTPIGAIAGGLLIYLQRAMTHYWQRRDRYPRDEVLPSVPRPKVFWPLLLGFGIVLASVIAVLLVFKINDLFTASINLYTTLAVFLASLPLWWLFM